MTVNKSFEGTKLVASVEGRLDTTTAPELSAALDEDIANITELVLDFANLQYISSAGLRVLLSLQKQMSKKGGMVVKNANDDIMEVFDITGFVDVLTIE